MQQHAAAQRQRQGHRVIGDLGGAVIGNVQHDDLTFRAGDAVDAVIADAHAANETQLWKPRQILLRHLEPQNHQPIRLGAFLIGEISERSGRALGHDDLHVRAVDAPLHTVIGIVVLGIQVRSAWWGRFLVTIAPLY